jgi:hypothetical protein
VVIPGDESSAQNAADPQELFLDKLRRSKL